MNQQGCSVFSCRTIILVGTLAFCIVPGIAIAGFSSNLLGINNSLTAIWNDSFLGSILQFTATTAFMIVVCSCVPLLFLLLLVWFLFFRKPEQPLDGGWRESYGGTGSGSLWD